MIEFSAKGGGVTLTINRPEKYNALSVDMYVQLSEGLQAAQDDPSCHSVIITAAGDHFTAGSDLTDFQYERPPGDSSGLTFLRTLASVDVPIVAAVQGYAIGVGVTLLQHCDFVYADCSTVFSIPFVALGLCPEGGSSLILEQLVGRRKTAEWLMQGKQFDAAEAMNAGLLTAVSDKGLALVDAKDTVAAMANLPVQALRLTKHMLREPGRASLNQAFDTERDHYHERLRTDEAQTAFKRFFDR